MSMSVAATATVVMSLPMAVRAPSISLDDRAGERTVHPRSVWVGGRGAAERHGRRVSAVQSAGLRVWHCQRTIITEETVNSARW